MHREQATASSQVLSIPPPPPGEDTPLLGNAHSQPLSSKSKTFANVFIAIVGAGVLGLPYCFKRTGWIMGVLMIFFVAALAYHCMMLLVHTRCKLESISELPKISSFGDLGFAVCGPIGRTVVDVMILLSQFGFCVSYLIFIADTLANLYFGSNIWGISSASLCIWGCFPFQLGLNSIKTLTHLAPLSIFADVVDLGAMGIVMAEELGMIAEKMPKVRAFAGPSMFFYGMGLAVYSFEGVGMVLPLESEAKDKSKFGGILAISMAFIALMYAGFGVLGYFAFGENVKDIITSNLGKGFVSSVIQLGLCINLFFTFPLMMHPVYEIIERRFRDGNYCIWSRWLLVLSVTLIALMVPNFADFLSLVGSSVCCGLAFVLPTLFHLLAFKGEISRKTWTFDVGIAVLGVILGISGTWYALAEIFLVMA
ncbi:hypothetical protein SAY87_019780 [Trapa incisa]|uniref:Amino acid transporter transmembrane domain-containing protein n=2 Tax=Trapa TaxID=22665 RepID=A0AAN7LUF6_TRANT|nr:hypothetical protein SAY87_019780 [Trapa incisa]KAK4792615.1 hypothetical protein SAY86_023050 [Trapa natans]